MTEADLLRAVLENPDDVGPRLVFADFLEEHGRASWAEFVRLDIAFSQRVPGGNFSAISNRLSELAQSLNDEGVPWKWHPPERQHEVETVANGGFVEEVRMPIRMFMQYVDELFSTRPLKVVRICDREPLPVSSRESTVIWDTWEGAGPDFVDEPHLLPAELLYVDRDAAFANEPPEPFVYVESFPNRQAAHEWLSRVCVKIGRARVGLRPLADTRAT